MTGAPTSDDIKSLTRAVEKVAQELSVLNHNQSQTAKIDAEVIASLERIKNELHERNRIKFIVKEADAPIVTTGD